MNITKNRIYRFGVVFMKKAFSIFLSLVLLCSLAVPAMAATEPVITQQPQNPDYPEYSDAEYSVTVSADEF